VTDVELACDEDGLMHLASLADWNKSPRLPVALPRLENSSNSGNMGIYQSRNYRMRCLDCEQIAYHI
jgi:hypothetical protein